MRIHVKVKWLGFQSEKQPTVAQLKLPAASAMNSFVQSASAASPREVRPGAEAESGPERNSAAQSPERASAATSGAMTRKYVVFKMLKLVNKTHTTKNKKDDVHLSVALVCNFAGQSAAFPPTADPCRTCVGVEGEPEGTHSQAARNRQTCYNC